MSERIRAIVFDMDETLLDRDATMLHFLRQQHNRFALTVDKESLCQSILGHQLGGYGDKLEAYQKACAEVKLPSSMATELFTDFIQNYGDESVLIEGVESILEALHGNVLLGMVTNGRSRSQRGKIRGAGLDRYFDVIKVSEEEKVGKPEPEIFHRCLAELHCSPSETLFVGDHPVNDVEGPHKIGMQTVWVRTKRYKEASLADFKVDHIKEIFEPEGIQLFGIELEGEV